MMFDLVSGGFRRVDGVLRSMSEEFLESRMDKEGSLTC